MSLCASRITIKGSNSTKSRIYLEEIDILVYYGCTILLYSPHTALYLLYPSLLEYLRLSPLCAT